MELQYHILRVAFAVVLTFAISLTAQAGPFGTHMGQPKEDFQGLSPIKSGNPGIEEFVTSEVPKKHTLFKRYILNFGNAGLVSIAGETKIFDNDRAATAGRAAYETLKKQLTEKYGKPENFENMSPDGIWKKDSEFAMSILKNERTHICVWKKDLPDDLKSINLLLVANSSDSVSVGLLYHYKNVDQVKENQEKIEKDSL